jgi:hypothetical protein
MCARVGNQRSHGVLTARVQTNAVRSLRHQRQYLYQSTYAIYLRRWGLILLSPWAHLAWGLAHLIHVSNTPPVVMLILTFGQLHFVIH